MFRASCPWGPIKVCSLTGRHRISPFSPYISSRAARGSPWPFTTRSSRTATPRTSRSRPRCNRPFRSSASPGTGAGHCASSGTIRAWRPRRSCGPRSSAALGESRYFILLASPEAAASKWVNREVEHWLAHHGPDTLLIGVTDGTLAWDEARGDFALTAVHPLPPVLKGRFPAEPKWIDLGAYRAGADVRDARLTELAADFAAAIRGIPKEDLLSEELRQQRNAVRLASAAAVLLLVLAGAAVTAAKFAVDNAQIARQQEQAATEQKQVAQQQRDRAEKTLTAATRTANDLVFTLAQDFRDQTGMPPQLTRRILDRVRGLQKQLAESGERTPELKRIEAAALGELHLTLLMQGDANAAIAAAERSRDLMQELTALDPANAGWQEDLQVSYSHLGDALRAAGRRADAIAAFRKAIEVGEALAAANAGKGEIHRNLAIDHQRLGDTLMLGGQSDEALTAYRKAFAILAPFGEASGDWQLSLSIAHHKIGDALLKAGQREQALGEFRADLELIKKAIGAFPGNARAQRSLATSYQKIGMTLAALRRWDEAIEAHLADIRIAEEIAAAAPDNTEWQSMRAGSYEMYYWTLRNADRRDQAKPIAKKLLAVREKVAAADQNNAVWQHRLVNGLTLAGDELLDDGDNDAASVQFQKALAILRKLTFTDPANVEWKNDIAVLHARIGRLLLDAGKDEDALKSYEAGLQQAQAAADGDPARVLYQRNLSAQHSFVGKVLWTLNRSQEASYSLDEAIRILGTRSVGINPEDDAIHYHDRGMLRFNLGQLEGAAADLGTALKLDPKQAYYVLWLHLVRARQHQDDAAELAGNADKLDRSNWPWPLIAFHLGQTDRDELQKAALADARPKVRAERDCDIGLSLGLRHLDKGERDEARRLLKSAVDTCERASIPHAVATWEFARIGGSQQIAVEMAAAIAGCDRLAASDLDLERPSSIPGVALAAVNPRAAVPACEAAVKAAPAQRRMLFQLGRAYEAAKDYDTAREHYARASELGHALAINNLGAMFAGAKGVPRDPVQARRLYNKLPKPGSRWPCGISVGCSRVATADRRTTQPRAPGSRRRPLRDGREPPTRSASCTTTPWACRRIRPRRDAGGRRRPRAATPRQCAISASFTSAASGWPLTTARPAAGTSRPPPPGTAWRCRIWA
jgi:tetratricopeptide (TPR) repeat protein